MRGVDDRELAFFGFSEDVVSFLESGAVWRGDEIAGHDGCYWVGEGGMELDVSSGDYTDKL